MADDPLKGLIGIIENIQHLEKAGFDTASMMFSFVGIDVFCLIGLPEERTSQNRDDFISWADKYMIAHKDQPYKYRGKDIYAARCAMLHSYSSEADIHSRDADIKKFAYHDGGKHMYNPEIDEKLVLIGMKSFTNDFINAVLQYFDDIKSNEQIRKNISSRLPRILAVVPINK